MFKKKTIAIKKKKSILKHLDLKKKKLKIMIKMFIIYVIIYSPLMSL